VFIVNSNIQKSLAAQLDLELGGFRVRLQSLDSAITFTHQPQDVCYLPFIDLVYADSPPPDLSITLQAATTKVDWQKALPAPHTIKTDSYYQVTDAPWYYQQTTQGQDIFVVPSLEPGIYHQILKLEPDYRHGTLTYNADTQPLPLDPTRLFGYPLDRLMIANRLMRDEGFLLHASGIGTPNGVILFTGPSGAGKTTLCQLSQQFADCTQLCDERIVVRRDPTSPTGYRAYGTPWPGEGNIYNRINGPLAAIFLISHAPTNQLKPAHDAHALTWLMREIFPTVWNREGLTFTLDFMADLLEKLPCYEYGFVPTIEAITYARQAVGL